MSQSSIEAVTIITVVVIGVILTIYLEILKRNGWLNRSAQFYRCPNPKCKKIFHKPVKVKDLAETPIRIYSACPECGTDLEQYLDHAESINTTDNSGCKYYFGYLSSRDKQEAIPKTCLECPKSLDCKLLDNKPKEPISTHIKRIRKRYI